MNTVHAFVAALALLVPLSARADDLDEPLPLATSAIAGVRYSRAFEPALPNDHTDEVAFDLRNRWWLGETLAYAFGLDASIGGADTGLVYELEAHVAGIAIRWDVGAFGLSSGIGFGGVTDSVPFAAQVPIEASLETGLGPLRLIATATVRFVFGDDARKEGSDLLGFADEVAASLWVRIGGERRYWGDTVAGVGPAIGVVYRERMGSHMLGVVLALSLSGGR